jgi:two-component system, NtrC family, sensor kinase
MLELLKSWLDPQGFMAHGNCYLWKPDLVWLHLVSDAAIALAYFSIPLTLVYFISQRKEPLFNWIFWLFGGFIVACGAGHLVNIWTLWHPAYWVAGWLKAFTAVISVITALELIPLVPKVLAMPSPTQLEAANRELEAALHQLQQTQFQLIQTEKMSGLGQLVAGVAHEINNPVNFIHGNLAHTHTYVHDLLNLLSLYQQQCPAPSLVLQAALDETDLEFLQADLPKMLSSMQVGTDRIRQIVLSLRNFTRLDEADMKFVNLHEGIDSTLMILQSQLKPKFDRPAITLTKLYGNLPSVECYAGQINQVFMNLISNAIDALEEGRSKLEKGARLKAGTLAPASVATLAPPLTCPPLALAIQIQTQLLDSGWVLIQISDNGAGMSEATKQHIFDPFFTTKPAGKGTGLGLSISHQIVVEKHGGQLTCLSTPGQGTTFQIKIPVQQSRRSTKAI